MEKYDLAEADLKKVIELGYDKATPYIYLINWVYSNGVITIEKDKEAYEALKEGEKYGYENDPAFYQVIDNEKVFSSRKLSEFYSYAGKVCHDNGKIEDSLKYFNKAEKPGMTDEGYVERALCYFKAGRLREARKDAQKFLTGHIIDEKSVDTGELERISDAYMVLGDYDRAMKNIKRALMIDPDDHGFHINIARIHIQKGEYDLAGKHLKIVRQKKNGGIWDYRELMRLEKKITRAKKT